MENDFIKEVKKNIYLSNNDLKILNKYNISYENFSNMKELMFYLEEIIDNEYVENDLEELLIKLSEYNYYFYTIYNKHIWFN